MKRIASWVLLIAGTVAVSMPARAQIFMGPNSASQAQKAAKREQKASYKAAKKQQKAMKKYRKMQQKAAKRSKHRA
ncbi:MAG: hypothetical protein WAL32_00705 [Terriglobales bacterium]